jgi:DNA-directed RNA polymerase specialized sigma24 family protein
MTEPFEREVRRAIEHFIAEILAMAQRAAIEVIRSAFAARANPTEASISGDRRPSGQSARRRTAPLLDSPAVSARMVALVRDHPGWSTAQISQSLGLHTGVVRRHLRQLADQDVIRIEEASLGGLIRRTYFWVSHVGEPTEQTAATEAVT